MKNLIYFLFAIVLFASCGNDDDMLSTSGDDSIVGTWNLLSITCDDGVTTTTGGGSVLSATYTFEGKDINSVTEYRADGTFEGTAAYTQVLSTIYPGSSDPVVQEIPVPSTTSSGTWSQSGDMLSATIAGQETQESKIISNDGTTLVIEGVLNNEQVSIIDGENYTVTQMATIITTLEKL